MNKKFLRKIQLIVFLFAAKGSLLASNDTIPEGSPRVFLPERQVLQEIYDHPGAAFSMPRLSTDGKIEASFDYADSKELPFIQEGDGLQQYSLLADGLIIKDHVMYWGSARYRSFEKRNVGWSYAYDYSRTAPYVPADSIGGNSQGEEYDLSGGLSVKYNRWTFGGEAGYQAGQNYRKTDPRPKSTATDLFLQVGAGYQLTDNYLTGISFRAGKYREKLSVTVVREKTNYAFFPLKGFGQYNPKLSEYGSDYSWAYDGGSYGGSLFFLPENKKGCIGNAYFNYESIDSNLGSNNTPYTLSTYSMGGKLGWQFKHSLICADYDYTLAKGWERIYIYQNVNDIYGQNFLLSSSWFYTRKTTSARMTFLQEWLTPQTSKWIQARIGYLGYEENYAYPVYRMQFDRMTSSVDLGGEFYYKSSTFAPRFSVAYSPLVSSRKILPEDNRIFDLSVLPDLDYLEADLTRLDVSLLYQKKLRSAMQLYTSAEASCVFDGNRKRVYFGLSVGVKY